MLKQLLQLLLNTRTTPEEATPNIANTVNVMLTTTESSAIVAPFDGYFNIETTAEGNPTINIWEALWCTQLPKVLSKRKFLYP